MQLVHIEDHNLDTVIVGKATKCRACPVMINWALMPNTHKKLPVHQNEHGIWVDHFNDCPAAEAFRNRELTINN